MSARQTLGIFQRAVAGRWELPPDTRRHIYEFASAVVNDPDQPIRARTNACKVLASLDATQSAENRSMVELTLKFELSNALADSLDQPLSDLPPLSDESMVDDEPQG